MRSLSAHSGLGAVRQMWFCLIVFDVVRAANTSDIVFGFGFSKELLFTLGCASTHTQGTGELLPRLAGRGALTTTLANRTLHFPLSAP